MLKVDSIIPIVEVRGSVMVPFWGEIGAINLFDILYESLSYWGYARLNTRPVMSPLAF